MATELQLKELAVIKTKGEEIAVIEAEIEDNKTLIAEKSALIQALSTEIRQLKLAIKSKMEERTGICNCMNESIVKCCEVEVVKELVVVPEIEPEITPAIEQSDTETVISPTTEAEPSGDEIVTPEADSTTEPVETL